MQTIRIFFSVRIAKRFDVMYLALEPSISPLASITTSMMVVMRARDDGRVGLAYLGSPEPPREARIPRRPRFFGTIDAVVAADANDMPIATGE
jgi:hypothetical protein